MIEVYTDGACSYGTGGWAWWLNDRCWAFGYEEDSTNNRMELMAALEAIKALSGNGEPIMVVSDSRYVVNCFLDGWHIKWEKKGWYNANGKPVLNRDLWTALLNAINAHKPGVRWRHVKGHSGVVGNEKADALAVHARMSRAHFRKE